MKRSLPNPPPRQQLQGPSSSTTPISSSASSGWDMTNPSARAPAYDSESDPYNKFSRTDKYKKHMRRQHKLEKLDREAKLRRSQSIGTLRGGMKPMDGNSLSMAAGGGGGGGGTKPGKKQGRGGIK